MFVKHLLTRKGSFELSRPLVMGILNITPDSFSGDGQLDVDTAVKKALCMVRDGADIIDIGGQSTRPNFIKITDDEELSRLTPVLKKLFNYVSVTVSVDTFYPTVAKEALSYGVDIINDVSGKIDAKMADIVIKSKCSWIITATDEALNQDPTKEVTDNINRLVSKAQNIGVLPEQICIDPGFGFGKTEIQCKNLIDNISSITHTRFPVLIGVSRKRMIRAMTDKDSVEEYDKISANLACFAAKKGANIIRTHNVILTTKELNYLYGQDNY